MVATIRDRKRFTGRISMLPLFYLESLPSYRTFYTKGMHLFDGSGKFPIFVESCFNMKTLNDLTKQADHCRTMVQYCADLIKMLNGYTPDGFKFAFSIHDIHVVTIPISGEDGNFCLGMFMGWHQFYSRKLKEVEREIVLTSNGTFSL